MKKRYMFILCSVLMFVGCSSPSSISLEGDIQNNIVSAISTVSGKITEMNKEQGEEVKKGDIIAVIDTTNQQYVVDQLQAVVNMKKAKLEELKNGARPEEIEAAEAQVRATKSQLDLLVSGNREEQIAQAKNEVAIAKENLEIAKLTHNNSSEKYQDATQLFNEGILTQYELDNEKIKFDTSTNHLSMAQYRVENANQQLLLLQGGSTAEAINIAKANYDASHAQYNLIKNGPTEQTIEVAEADLEQSIAQLKQAQNTLENCNIKALEDGIIISKNYGLGDVVNIGSNILDIAITNDVYVLCYIPVKYLNSIVYNQELDVKTDNGIQKGRVSYIALEKEYTPKDQLTSEDRKHKLVKIKVAISDDGGSLKSGMTAEVEVPLKEKATTH